MAVVAGANLIFSPDINLTMSRMKFFSPDSRCYTFDARSNGYARGEGVAALILKPLRDAVRDNDLIRAVIRATGTNQDGRTQGITNPSFLSQSRLLQSVFDQAGLDPSTVEYFESHGTATVVGDQVEARSIGATLGKGRTTPLYVGSIKVSSSHLSSHLHCFNYSVGPPNNHDRQTLDTRKQPPD